MCGKTNLSELLSEMKPQLHDGDYVFTTVNGNHSIDYSNVVAIFKEQEGTTLILEKSKAESYHLKYDYIASWITLTVHSSLEAVGLTAAVSKALAKYQISCNVVAAYYHDHIFVAKKDAEKAIEVLQNLTLKNSF